jgi:hypothetical protein
MAANRPTVVAPHDLTKLSKATLADMVWDLVAVSPDCTSCDDHAQMARILMVIAQRVKASGADMGRLASLVSELERESA